MKLFPLSLLVVTIGLVGCEPTQYTESTRNYALPDDLKDCRMYYLQSERSTSIVVTRCPMSSTTTSYDQNCGKGCVHHLNNAVEDPNVQ